MNKEQQELLGEAYKNYHSETFFKSDNKWLEELDGMNLGTGEKTKVHRQYVLGGFINRCKTDTEFSEKWGLKIEERELSLEERKKLYEDEFTPGIEITNDNWLNSKLTTRNIPTKLVTMKYNDKTIESYE
jgi:hypothetical protein